MNFLVWENIGQKNWENFVLEKIESTILGKYWEILRVHSTCPNFFWIWEMFFQKWENIGNRVVKCFWIFPILGRNGTQLSYGGKSLGEKLDQVKVTVELNFLFQSHSSPPSLRKKESRVALGTRMLAPVLFLRMRTRTARSIQIPVQKMPLFLASSSQNSDLEPNMYQIHLLDCFTSKQGCALLFKNHKFCAI